MNLEPSDDIVNQLTALYSQDRKSVPPMKQCFFPYNQTGSTDGDIYAVDLAAGDNASDIIYDQSGLCRYLLQCMIENRTSIFLRHRLCPVLINFTTT